MSRPDEEAAASQANPMVLVQILMYNEKEVNPMVLVQIPICRNDKEVCTLSTNAGAEDPGRRWDE